MSFTSVFVINPVIYLMFYLGFSIPFLLSHNSEKFNQGFTKKKVILKYNTPFKSAW